MTFILNTPTLARRTRISFDRKELETGTCGLFRAPLHLAAHLMPSMAELVASVPVDDPENWELDIKVHMLMPGQYPCIPNWHCDNVPRDESGLRFDLVNNERDVPPMLLWVSEGPFTEFLANSLILDEVPGSHRELAKEIEGMRHYDHGMTQLIEPNAWYAMDQKTAHRGTAAVNHGWRVFARATPKAIAPARPVNSVIRRHAQVYLDAKEFGW